MKAFIFVVLAGAAIGLMLPSRQGDAPATAPAAPNTYRETMLERRMDGHFYVHAEVNGRQVHFLVDTGATIVALTLDDARRIGLKFDPATFSVVGRGASGDIYGELVTLDFVDIEGKRVPHVPAMIAQDLPISLLGQAYLSRITAVHMNGDYMKLR